MSQNEASPKTHKEPMRPETTQWFLMHQKEFKLEKLEANEMLQGNGTFFAKIPKISDRIRSVWDEEHQQTSIRLVIGRSTDEQTGEITEETVEIGVDMQGLFPGMMLASEVYHDYFDIYGNLIQDPLQDAGTDSGTEDSGPGPEAEKSRDADRHSDSERLKEMVAKRLKEENSINLGDITLVRIPDIPGKIRILPPNKRGIRLVEYKYSQWYDPVKKQTRNYKVIIGQVSEEYPGAMIPSKRYSHHFSYRTGEAWNAETEEERARTDKAIQEIRKTADEMKRKREEAEQRKAENERLRKLYGEDSPELSEIATRELQKMWSETYDREDAEYQQQIREYNGETGEEAEDAPPGTESEEGSMDEKPEEETYGEEDNPRDEIQSLYSRVSHDRERAAVLMRILEAVTKSISSRARKRPDDIINAYKAQKINAILKEIRERYQGSGYEDLLELIQEPEKAEEDGQTVTTGMTYSDAEVLLSHYLTITEHIRPGSDK